MQWDHRQEYFLASEEKKNTYSSRLDLISEDLFTLILAIGVFPQLLSSTPGEAAIGTA